MILKQIPFAALLLVFACGKNVEQSADSAASLPKNKLLIGKWILVEECFTDSCVTEKDGQIFEFSDDGKFTHRAGPSKAVDNEGDTYTVLDSLLIMREPDTPATDTFNIKFKSESEMELRFHTVKFKFKKG